MATIYAPDATYGGTIGSVRFAAGRAETDDAAVLAYCARHGYRIDHAGDAAEPAADEAEPDADGPAVLENDTTDPAGDAAEATPHEAGPDPDAGGAKPARKPRTRRTRGTTGSAGSGEEVS